MSRKGDWTFEQDLEAVFEANADIWHDLEGRRIFITGGTGLLGRWMLETLRHADTRLGLAVRAIILTRDPEAFARRAPHLAGYDGFEFIAGDVRDFVSPPGAFSHIIHAATDASATLTEHDPKAMFETVVLGTRRALELAVEKQPERFFFMSSGAVYGPQPWDLERVSEAFAGGPDFTDPIATYAEGKRAAEMLCNIYAKQFGVRFTTARIFALLGPLLTLDIHFAAGNFIRDAMAGRPVVVESSGQACRSYLYLSDVTSWLWRVMLRAAPGSAHNVGSEEWVTIRDLAERTARLLSNGAFEIRGASDTGWNPGRYVPDTTRARTELGLSATVSLDESILRTAIWNGWKK